MIDDYVKSGEWAKSGYINGKQHSTRSYSKWNAMINRCRSGSRANRVAYKNCGVSDDFKDFQQFTNWHTEQIGYGLGGYALDKDILFPHGNIYSRESCVIIPQALNNFLTHKKSNKGVFPTGVNFSKSMKKLVSRIRIDNVDTILGYFETSDSAEKAYLKAKQLEILRWCDRLENNEFVVDKRVLEALYKLTKEKQK